MKTGCFSRNIELVIYMNFLSSVICEKKHKNLTLNADMISKQGV